MRYVLKVPAVGVTGPYPCALDHVLLCESQGGATVLYSEGFVGRSIHPVHVEQLFENCLYNQELEL